MLQCFLLITLHEVEHIKRKKLENLDSTNKNARAILVLFVFNEFGKTYNLPPLPHKNVSKKVRSNWRDMYNQETAKRVYEIYQEDCDVWYPEAYLDLQKHIEEVKPS